MLRELAIFLCAVGIASTSRLHHSHHTLHGSPAQSSGLFSTPAPPFSGSTVQPYDGVPIEAKILQSQGAVNAYSAQEYAVQGPAPVAYAYVASPSASYSIDPAIVKTVASPVAVPVAQKKITIEAHQHVTAHPPTASFASSYPVPVATQPVQQVQTIVNPPGAQYIPAPFGRPPVQVGTNTVYKTVTAHPPSAAYVTSTLAPKLIHPVQAVARPAVQYVSASVAPGVVRTVPNVPVAAKKVTIEAHQSVTAHPPTAVYITPPPIVARPVHPIQAVVNRPAVQYVSSPIAQPVQVAQNTIQSHGTVTAHPPSTAYVTSTVAPPPIHQVQTVVKRPTVQYVSAPVTQIKPVFVKPVAPTSPRTVTIESHQSVIAHPNFSTVAPIGHVVASVPSSQYIPAQPALVSNEISSVSQHSASQYPFPPPVVKPIPVPVIYNPEESFGSQFLGVSKLARPSPAVVSYPALVPQPIPVPVSYPKSGAYVRYNHKISTPVVYTKSLVEKDHASGDLVATHVSPGYASYARAAKYSPASAVSSVSFNGLGVSYAW